MMELIDYLSPILDNGQFDFSYKAGVRSAIAKANKLLEKEKEQIMNAYIDGEQAQGYEDEANLYYNQTYLEESNEKI